MSTRSAIILQRNDNKYQGIYCHSNGYPSWNGLMLKFHYSKYDKVQELINLGDISCLRQNIRPIGKHSFDDPEEGVVVAYHRDRGEELSKPNMASNVKTVVKRIDCEYVYVFSNGEWRCLSSDGKDDYSLNCADTYKIRDRIVIEENEVIASI